MTDAQKLREAAQIAETHFATTFGTDRVAALRRTADALDAKDSLLAQAAAALGQMTEDTEHLTNILESKAEQEWDYEYERPRIANAREALAAIRAKEHP